MYEIIVYDYITASKKIWVVWDIKLAAYAYIAAFAAY